MRLWRRLSPQSGKTLISAFFSVYPDRYCHVEWATLDWG